MVCCNGEEKSDEVFENQQWNQMINQTREKKEQNSMPVTGLTPPWDSGANRGISAHRQMFFSAKIVRIQTGTTIDLNLVR